MESSFKLSEAEWRGPRGQTRKFDLLLPDSVTWENGRIIFSYPFGEAFSLSLCAAIPWENASVNHIHACQATWVLQPRSNPAVGFASECAVNPWGMWVSAHLLHAYGSMGQNHLAFSGRNEEEKPVFSMRSAYLSSFIYSGLFFQTLESSNWFWLFFFVC